MFYSVGELPSPRLPWQPADPVDPGGNLPGGVWDHRIISVACRHLNSGYPVLVGTQDHAFILCGYRRTDTPKPGWIEFVRHDDQRGPYRVVGDVLHDVDAVTGDVYTPWRTMHVPVPEKLWLAPEAAERKAGILLYRSSERIADAAGSSPPFTRLSQLVSSQRLALRTYAVRSNTFKEALAARGMAPNIAREYRLARLPRFVWVVEVVDRQLRTAGQPCVIGEAVLDATSSDHAPEVISLHIHGVMWLQQTSGNIRFPIFGATVPYSSGGVGSP